MPPADPHHHGRHPVLEFQLARDWQQTLRAASCAQLQKRRRQATVYRQKELGYNRKDTRLLVTTDDLADALRQVLRCIPCANCTVPDVLLLCMNVHGCRRSDQGFGLLQYGVNVKRAPYHADRLTN